jgi:hypothetical protein
VTRREKDAENALRAGLHAATFGPDGTVAHALKTMSQDRAEKGRGR